MSKNTILAFVLFVFSSGALGEPELKGSPNELRGFLHPKDKIVTITGYSEKKAYSDKAIVSLIVTTKKETLSAALADNSNLRKSIVNQLTNSGIDPDAIKSSKFSSSPEYGWFSKKPSNYKVVNRLAISIMEEEQLQKIARVADDSGEIDLADTSFEHTRKIEFEESVRAGALDKVLSQKKFYEESLGLKLTPIGVRDSDVRHRATRGALVLEEVIVTAQKNTSDGYSSYSPDKVDEAPSFDEVFYEATVAVDFKIEG